MRDRNDEPDDASKSPPPRSSLARDVLGGVFMGVLMALVSVFVGLAWSGAGGFTTDSDVVKILLVYLAAFGFAGLIGGLLRPLLHTLPAQALFNFAIAFGLVVGILILIGAPNAVRTAVLVAAMVTPFGVLFGRASGFFRQVQE